MLSRVGPAVLIGAVVIFVWFLVAGGGADKPVKPVGPKVQPVAPAVPPERTKEPPVPPTPQTLRTQAEFVTSRIHEDSRFSHAISAYTFGGEIKEDELISFCLDRKSESKASGFSWTVVFDSKENAKLPQRWLGGSHGYDSEPEVYKHVRAVYCFNKVNGYSVVYFHQKNVFEHATKELKVK